MLSKELVAASTVPLVLSVLADGESYGYALIQRVRELSGGGIAWTEGMLYPVLHWMEDHAHSRQVRQRRREQHIRTGLLVGSKPIYRVVRIGFAADEILGPGRRLPS